MKKILGFVAAAILITGCSSCSSTGTNSTNAPASNTTNSAPETAENKTIANQPANNVTIPAKKEESSATKKTGNPSQKTERVQFASGKTDGAYTRDIPAEGSIDFVMNAKKGQTIDYTVGYDFKDSDIEAFLTEPELQDISQTAPPKDRQEFKVNKTGDHRITVNNTTKKKVTITLYLDIQ